MDIPKLSLRKTPSIDDVKVTHAILTCDCANCQQQLKKLDLTETQFQQSLDYCIKRLENHGVL